MYTASQAQLARGVDQTATPSSPAPGTLPMALCRYWCVSHRNFIRDLIEEAGPFSTDPHGHARVMRTCVPMPHACFATATSHRIWTT